MKNFIRFTDFFTAKPLQIKDSEENKDFFISFGKKDPRKYRSSYENLNGIPDVLGVKIAATHAGKVTGNNGFYLPDKMQAGVSSWLLPFPKPILLHHDDEEDAIGRLEDARYVDISMGFRQDFIKRKDTIVGDKPSDVLIDAFLKGELSPAECIDVVNNVFLIKDFNYTKDQSYPGLGYIEITASISDPDSIRKIIDKRYLTGSIGARTDAAVCNVCKKDWTKEDGMCEHRPGQEYDGVLCTLIAGNLMYDEYSYVNRPADSHSQTIEIFQNGEVKNSFNYNESNDSIPEVGFNIVDSLTVFKNKEQPKMKLDLEKIKELLNSFIEEKFSLFKDHLDLDKLAQKFLDSLEDETTEEQLVQKFADQLTKYNLFFEDSEEFLGSDPSDEDYVYADMLIDFMLDKEISQEEKEALWDAKLSTTKRKSLPDSAFCGPDRSFPVNDCAHYTAALRLLSRYKGSGDKNKIRACIERKGKRLGCNKKKDNVDDTQDVGIGQFTVDYFDNFEDQEILQMLNGLEFVLEERDLANPCGCEDMKKKISSLEEQLEKTTNNDELKTELQNTIDDNKNLKNKITELSLSLKNSCIDKLVLFKKLTGEKIEDTLQKDLSEKTLTDITSLVAELEEKVDIEKLNDMLNLGISRQPTEKIQDPTLKFQDKTLDTKDTDSKIIEDKEITITKEYLMDVQKTYMKLRIQNGLEAANDYLNKLKLAGFLPTEIPEFSDNNT